MFPGSSQWTEGRELNVKRVQTLPHRDVASLVNPPPRSTGPVGFTGYPYISLAFIGLKCLLF